MSGIGFYKPTLIFSIPFHHGSGELAARHVVAVHLQSVSGISKELIDAAGREAARSLGARLRRARRLAAAAAAAGIEVERAIADVVRASVPHEAQPGLFDARELHAFEEIVAGAADVDARLSATIERLALRADVTIGRPVLELIVGGAT
jgi:hypothetical protein